MRQGLLVCSGTSSKKNIGDYMQSLAQEQFLSEEYAYVERESLDDYASDEPTKLVMNGWFMANPKRFPPSRSILPLFISFHITPRIASVLLSPENVAYLKKFEPIGARDRGTQRLLQEKGIESYFSGCLTLTLNQRYKNNEKTEEMYFVDPYYEFVDAKTKRKKSTYLKAIFALIRYFFKVRHFQKKFVCEEHSFFYKLSHNLDRWLMASSFYSTYSKIFSDSVLFDATYITHKVDQSLCPDNYSKMEYARSLLKKYARAKFVVTSRIHCGLPCLGVETPVIFVTSEALEGNSVRSGGRFEGLLELFHVARWEKKGVVLESKEMETMLGKGKIEKDTEFINKNDYIPLRDGLIRAVKGFLL